MPSFRIICFWDSLFPITRSFFTFRSNKNMTVAFRSSPVRTQQPYPGMTRPHGAAAGHATARFQHCRLLIRNGFRQFDQIALRHCHILRKSPILSGTKVAVISAQLILSPPARNTAAARDQRKNADPLIPPFFIRASAGLHYPSANSCPGISGHPVRAGLIDPWNVRSADSRRLHFH